MDEFLVTLVLVLLFITGMVLLAMYYPYYPEGLPVDVRVLYSFSAGTVGSTENYVSRVQNFGSFGVGVPQDEELKAVPMMEISAGLFGSASEKYTISIPEHVIEWLKGGEMTFTIDEANQYGDLKITWNGEEVFKGRPELGSQNIKLQPDQIKSENVVEISADGPGLMFWAATFYRLRNFRVIAKYGPAKFLDFDVSQDELESLDRFELKWYTTSRSGELVIKHNGEQIYSGSPERQMTVTFTDNSPASVLINPGKNRLAFTAINGSFQLEDALLNTYVSKSQRAVKERFSLNESQVNSLNSKGGKVRIYVNSVGRAGDLLVSINERSIGSVAARNGWNTFAFSGSLAERGTNWIEVSGTGKFDVGEVSVELAG